MKLEVGGYYESRLTGEFLTTKEEGPWKLLSVEKLGHVTVLTVWFLNDKWKASLGIEGDGWKRTFEEVVIL